MDGLVTSGLAVMLLVVGRHVRLLYLPQPLLKPAWLCTQATVLWVGSGPWSSSQFWESLGTLRSAAISGRENQGPILGVQSSPKPKESEDGVGAAGHCDGQGN